jgi:hypothetical protein
MTNGMGDGEGAGRHEQIGQGTVNAAPAPRVVLDQRVFQDISGLSGGKRRNSRGQHHERRDVRRDK